MAIRLDGRSADQLRPVSISPNWLSFAEGSALVAFGETRVLCAASVAEGVPHFQQEKGQGWVTAEYAMLPRADRVRTVRERVKGQMDGRAHEISRLVSRALRSNVDLGELGNRTVTVDCDVLQADGGTRTAAITGAYVALAAAVQQLRKAGELPESATVLKGTVTAVSVGVVDGEPMLDLCYAEDVRAETDMNVVCSADGRLIEVQGAAEKDPVSRERFSRLLDLGALGCARLVELQQQALEAIR